MNLQDAHVLVTGGARRLGRAICLSLAHTGAHVHFTYRESATDAAHTCEALRQLGSQAQAYPCDVAHLPDVQDMRDRIQQQTASLALIVNTASPYVFEALPFPGYDQWHQVSRTSIDGCLYVCNEFLPLLRQAEAPSIVNILDMTVRHPWPGLTAHAVGKSGMEALTRQLALELAPQIRVNGIVPGPVLPLDHMSAEAYQRVEQKTLLKRWGTPRDVTRGIHFLVASSYMTGSILFIDGGESIGMRSG